MNLWKANQERIAVVYSTADEGKNNRGKDMRGNEESKCSNPPQVVCCC